MDKADNQKIPAQREAETRDGKSQAVFNVLVSLISKPAISMPFLKFVSINQEAPFLGQEHGHN